jgi:hypothetical protein
MPLERGPRDRRAAAPSRLRVEGCTRSALRVAFAGIAGNMGTTRITSPGEAPPAVEQRSDLRAGDPSPAQMWSQGGSATAPADRTARHRRREGWTRDWRRRPRMPERAPDDDPRGVGGGWPQPSTHQCRRHWSATPRGAAIDGIGHGADPRGAKVPECEVATVLGAPSWVRICAATGTTLPWSSRSRWPCMWLLRHLAVRISNPARRIAGTASTGRVNRQGERITEKFPEGLPRRAADRSSQLTAEQEGLTAPAAVRSPALSAVGCRCGLFPNLRSPAKRAGRRKSTRDRANGRRRGTSVGGPPEQEPGEARLATGAYHQVGVEGRPCRGGERWTLRRSPRPPAALTPSAASLSTMSQPHDVLAATVGQAMVRRRCPVPERRVSRPPPHGADPGAGRDCRSHQSADLPRREVGRRSAVGWTPK